MTGRAEHGKNRAAEYVCIQRRFESLSGIRFGFGFSDGFDGGQQCGVGRQISKPVRRSNAAL